jgi:Amt family ammonium transporter
MSPFQVYYGARRLLFRLQIDDPLDAFPLHGCCGFFSVLATGMFCTDENVQYSAYPNVNNSCASGEQFGVQLVGGLIIWVWAFSMSGMLFLGMHKSFGIRVPQEVELEGLDKSEHGGQGGVDFVRLVQKPAVLWVGQNVPVPFNAVAPQPL